MTLVLASLMFGSLLSPPLLLLLAVGWLCGAHALMTLPVALWALTTVWLTANAGLRHHRGRRFLDAITEAPLDVVDQLSTLLRRRRRRPLRAI